jgi:hypothetical protein
MLKRSKKNYNKALFHSEDNEDNNRDSFLYVLSLKYQICFSKEGKL